MTRKLRSLPPGAIFRDRRGYECFWRTRAETCDKAHWRVLAPGAGLAGAGFDDAAQRRSGQGVTGGGRARPDDDAAGLDGQTSGDGQPRLFNLAAVPAGEPILKYANTIDRPLNGAISPKSLLNNRQND